MWIIVAHLLLTFARLLLNFDLSPALSKREGVSDLPR